MCFPRIDLLPVQRFGTTAEPCSAGRDYNRGLASISVIIPAYNEESRLSGTLDAVVQYLDRHSFWTSYEILVVDDGSTDGTVAVAERFARQHPSVRVLRNPGNRGKGYSVRHGMLEAKGEWRLFSDADLSTPIEELEILYQATQKNGCAIAIASRAIDRSLIEARQSWFRELGGRGMNLIMQCGFKLFRRDAAEAIFPLQIVERFGFDPELLFLGRKFGYGICEIPARWKHVEGTKVRLLQDSLRMVFDLLAIRMRWIQGRYRIR
jgi:dolichyl-phosphate beta-glucosyltransferase